MSHFEIGGDKRIYQHLSKFPPKPIKGNVRIADETGIVLVRLLTFGPDTNKGDAKYFL
jgi:hypothetical protein